MRYFVVLAVAIALWSPPALAESMGDKLLRMEAKLLELERAIIKERRLAGPEGEAGEPGTRGPRGARGAQGPDGSKGQQGLRGPQGIRGSKGDRGAQGTRGPKGDRGAQGSRGPKGAGGESASLTNVEELRFRNGRLDIESNSAGKTNIDIYNKKKKQIAFLGEWSDQPAGGLFVADKDGKRMVALGSRDSKGFVFINGKKIHDYAELFELATRDGIEAGSVVAWDAAAGGIVPASATNARSVIGAVSGAGGFRPGIVIGSRTDESRDFPVSMSGAIYVRVSAEGGAIEPGDLLVPSSAPGIGMRAGDPVAAAGTVFGKALEPWTGPDEGLVLMLVMNR